MWQRPIEVDSSSIEKKYAVGLSWGRPRRLSEEIGLVGTSMPRFMPHRDPALQADLEVGHLVWPEARATLTHDRG